MLHLTASILSGAAIGNPSMLRAPMKRLLALAGLSAIGWTSNAIAAEPTATGEVPTDLAHLIHDTGRPLTPPPEPDTIRFRFGGEYQLRYQAQRSFPLEPTASAVARNPGLRAQSIGQNQFVSHWLRLTPRLQLFDSAEVVGQIDLVTGLVLGDTARDTHADRTPRDAYDGFSNVQPRWLYAQYMFPFGLLRVGQQPNHWGMGILANDGDHPPLFGDYRYGSISERILFATKPAGRDSDVTVAIAADLVFRDNTARLIRGDRAFQGVLAAFYERGSNMLGVFSTLRHQESSKTSASIGYTDELDALAVDVYGRVAAPVPGDPDSFFFGEAEAAYIFGSTNFVRTPEQARTGTKTKIRSYGGAAKIGFVHRSYAPSPSESDARAVAAFGDLVTQVEVGYASGDADPYDGTERRFTFDPNHRVGLLLFDEVLRWHTARAATAATDPLLTNATRPAPGVDLLPSNGGVYGAQYINPTVIVRPRRWLDLKGGVVVAQATSEIVDPYRIVTGGDYVNYRGGDRRNKDLGVELDAGVEARIALTYGLVAQLGAQGGVLFPGSAFEDQSGLRLPPQWMAVGRFGLLF